MEELEKVNKEFESRIINILEEEIDELNEKLSKLLNKILDLSEKARRLDETIRDIIYYDSYVDGVIAEAKKILQEYE
jgi:predicted  nucleic acid-binding Zn-ribbon protein